MIDRRHFLHKAAAISSGALFFEHLLYAQRGLLPMHGRVGSPTFKNITKDVGYFTERGGTIGWLASRDGVVIVDTQFPEQSEHLLTHLEALQELNIRAVINTHHHGDHTAGNIVFKDKASMIVGHNNCVINQRASAASRGKEEQQVYASTTFDTSYELEVGDEVIKCQYYGAGHTNGDIVVHFTKANVVHMGDLIFNRRFPYIDKGAGASVSNWVSVLDAVDEAYSDSTSFIFGHSDNGYDVVGKKEDIKSFKNYLERLLHFGEQCKQQGMSLEEAKAMTTIIPGAEQWTGKGIARSLDAVYLELGIGE